MLAAVCPSPQMEASRIAMATSPRSPDTSSPFASLASALTVAYAWAILRERPARPVLVGAALVAAGVVVLAL